MKHCHISAEVTAIGVWDAVKALGLRMHLIWRFFEGKHQFHNDQIDACARSGFHALALDETWGAYRPVMWTAPPDWPRTLEQCWFRGNHGDVGGQVMGSPQSRPLSNISFVWVMQRLQSMGLPLPLARQVSFAQDVTVLSTGNWSGASWLFIARSKRYVGRDPSERIHVSVPVESLGVLADFYDNAGG